MRIKIISFHFVSIILSLYIALFIIEVVLIFTNLDHQLKTPSIQKIISLKIKSLKLDSRNIFEFYSDYKNENPNIVLSTTSTGLNSHLDSSFTLDSGEKIFPLSGISNKETILNNESGYFIKYNSDNFGFNNPFKWKKKYDYLLLGDSIVEGFGVNEENNIAGNLKKLLNKQDGVLNLGRGANGPLKNYATLKEYINLLKIDKIFYFHTAANDLDDLKLELQNSILSNYLTNKNYLQNLSQLQKIIDKNLMIKTEMLIKKYYNFTEPRQKSKFIKHLKLHRLVRFKNKIFRNLKKLNEEDEQSANKKLIHDEFKNILKLMNDLSAKKNIKFYFIYVPSYYNNSPEPKNEKIIHYDEEYYLEIISMVNELKIPIIDLREKLFEKKFDPLSLIPFRMKGHFNKKGNKIISNLIFNEVK